MYFKTIVTLLLMVAPAAYASSSEQQNLSICSSLENNQVPYRAICEGVAAGYQGDVLDCYNLTSEVSQAVCMGLVVSTYPKTRTMPSSLWDNELWSELFFRASVTGNYSPEFDDEANSMEEKLEEMKGDLSPSEEASLKDGIRFFDEKTQSHRLVRQGSVGHLIVEALGTGDEIGYTMNEEDAPFESMYEQACENGQEFLEGIAFNSLPGKLQGLEKNNLWEAVIRGAAASYEFVASKKESDTLTAQQELRGFIYNRLGTDPEAEKISENARSWGFTHLAHYTSPENFVSMMEQGGIYSVDELVRKGIMTSANCSFANTKVAYLQLFKQLPVNEGTGAVYLVFSPDVLDSERAFHITPNMNHCGHYSDKDSTRNSDAMTTVDLALGVISHNSDLNTSKDEELGFSVFKNEVCFDKFIDFSHLESVYVEAGVKAKLIETLKEKGTDLGGFDP